MGKRSFYSDDEDVVPQAGLAAPIAKELEEKQVSHPAESIDGMTIRSTPILEKYMGELRKFADEKYKIFINEKTKTDKLIDDQVSDIKTQYNSVIVEPILPQSIAILTAALSGSILVNQRSLPIRFLTPIIIGTAAFAYVMPKSSKNVYNILENYEKEFPEVEKFHKDSCQSVTSALDSTKSTLNNANENLVNQVGTVRKAVEDWLNSK
ncbi:hypothetical protein B5S28_g1553 [[Candida] boidinii]|uniref:Unnamed protein product n=1 Tax=Candida boidinii TaxID=5477 RepID=A0ACB5TVQ5_CANBO|nr:hypothetical protein B5S28_g1553 [[Candida] boidinii]OWB60997.1 hypothetical protein B5S29_g1880 [[Candida] boidinii]OWB72296.1 hypothetical protein B5S31_g2003 [[Candida] boidinii]OWB78388.1 hypothetical protein B5S32_g2582 [[Candida] boidinii]GME72959.1 unnamed protein product [[Candida] boidinii]